MDQTQTYTDADQWHNLMAMYSADTLYACQQTAGHALIIRDCLFCLLVISIVSFAVLATLLARRSGVSS